MFFHSIVNPKGDGVDGEKQDRRDHNQSRDNEKLKEIPVIRERRNFKDDCRCEHETQEDECKADEMRQISPPIFANADDEAVKRADSDRGDQCA